MVKGIFDRTLVPGGWFDETAQAVGWFDETLLDTASSSAANITCSAIASVEVFGQPALAVVIMASAVASGEAIGSQALSVGIIATAIVSTEAFGNPLVGDLITYSGILKRWNGSAWVNAKLNKYDGSFTPATLKMWDGSAWSEINAAG